jgi:hypothetical protein
MSHCYYGQSTLDIDIALRIASIGTFRCSWSGTYFGIHILVDGSGELLLHGKLHIDFYFTLAVSLSESNSNCSLWSSGYDRPVTIDFKWHLCLFPTFIWTTKGIHVHFSHSPINYAFNFILTFLPKKILGLK